MAEKKKKGYAEKLRTNLRHSLENKFGLHKNLPTGIEANLSGASVDKIGSDKAIGKSKQNGFSVAEHFEVANQIAELFQIAELTTQRGDKNCSVNIKSIKRFDAKVKLESGASAVAHITVKESVQHGHKIYSLEVLAEKNNG